MSTPRLGAPVTFDMADVLGRYSDALPSGHPARSGYLKRWKPNPYYRRGDTRTGVIVGVRTLVNGYATWQYSDEPIIFYPEEHFTAYLVAFDLRRKPVYLLPDDVTIVPTDRGDFYRSEVEAMQAEARRVMGATR